jgi:hypothetical protein
MPVETRLPTAPGGRRRRGRVVLVIVIFVTVLAYAPVLLAIHVAPALVVPTAVGICMLATRVAQRLLALVDEPHSQPDSAD